MEAFGPYDGLLLVGPTGAGKTPLGRFLQQRGFRQRPCLHFDFGEHLRRVAQTDVSNTMVSRRDILFVRRLLQTGALLEDKDFPLARRILQSFLSAHDADQGSLIVLNGLPRHVGQATALAHHIRVRYIIWLQCDPETVYARIAANSGGDRAGRVDDGVDAVRRKLELFAQRTMPLIDYYRQANADIITVPVTTSMTAADAWKVATT